MRAPIIALVALTLGSGLCVGVAQAQQCPVGAGVDFGYTLHLSNGEGFRVDKVVDSVTYVSHVDNRGNRIGSEELYRGLFTLATDNNKGRTVYTYDIPPAEFFALGSEGTAEVGGRMIPENGRPSQVYRSWTLGGGGTKSLDAGYDRAGLCIYNVRYISSVTVWPELGLEFRQQKHWSDTLNMVLYLRTEVYEHGVQTRVAVYDANWIEE